MAMATHHGQAHYSQSTVTHGPTQMHYSQPTVKTTVTGKAIGSPSVYPMSAPMIGSAPRTTLPPSQHRPTTQYAHGTVSSGGWPQGLTSSTKGYTTLPPNVTYQHQHQQQSYQPQTTYQQQTVT
eukprot:Polyplicarium_translucidae@DN1326_c0_g1_i3.p1